MEESFDVDVLIDGLIEREGGYVNHPADKGGPTCFGITEARAHGYAGAMRSLPRIEAAAIYRRLYWLRPRFDQVAKRSDRIAAELFDTGVNMGPAVATTFLQRALTALNRNAKDYADLTPDGRVGPLTLHALDAFLASRGKRGGETVLLRALEALQGERYLRLAERRPANEAFLYGWLANRIGTIGCAQKTRGTVNLVNFPSRRILQCQFWKRSSGRCRSCSTRSSPTRRRGTGPSWSC